MRTAVRAGLLLGNTALASMVTSNWSRAQTELPEVKVTAPKEEPKPAPKETAARKPAPRTIAAPRQVATPAPPPPSPEQVAAQAAQKVIQQNQVLDQKITNNITPPLGASTYVITQQAIENQPGGTNTPLDKVLLQAPGVTQDADVQGGIHIRNEHANIAYRFNGIMLPEGVQGFGQVLESNFIGSMALLTGVLPAQYGLRTAGVLDITTRIPNTPGSGSVSMYGGSHETATPSFEYGGVVGQTQYFATGRYWGSDIGLNNTTPDRQAIHDNTAQARGFAYMSTLLDPETRVSTIFGAWKAKFQIPNTPGNFPAFQVNGVGPLSPLNNSATLNENQYESNVVGVMAWQRSTLQYDAQLAYFTRYNSVNFKPDTLGDIVFNGVASNVFRGAFVNGVQGDAAYRLNELHTLRAGFISSGETTNVNGTNGVLGMDDTGATSADPFTIIDPVSKVGWIAGVYLQDEWKLTDQLTLNYGFRFDQMWQFVNTNQLSPRVNMIYTPWDGAKIHAGYARYFTPPVQALAGPTNTLAFVNTTNPPGVLQNSPVLPERSHVFDVGATQQFGGFLTGLEMGVDGYYKIARDLIDDGQFGAAYILTAFNYEKGENYGVEWTTKYRNGPFSLYGNLAWAVQRATNIVSNQQLFGPDELAFIANSWVFTDHAQTYTASGGMAYVWNGTRISADMIYGSGLRAGDFNLDHVPAYGQMNLGLSREIPMPGEKPITVRFDVLNVFDSTYFIRDGTGIGVFASQFGPRRGYFVGVSQRL
ncbi:MAG: TonB-dependent receptor [Xanthobacteraceae bacterium]